MNVYFELTREFNRLGPVAALASGQAVVYYRLAITSKDGDWIVRDTPEACRGLLPARPGAGLLAQLLRLPDPAGL